MNFFILDDLLMRRLKENVRGVVSFFGAVDMKDVQEKSQAAPLVALIYDGYAIRDTNPGTVQVVQRWAVVVGVHVKDYTEPGMSARQAAGEIVTDVITTLQGYTPEEFPNVKRMTLAQSSGIYLDAGLLLVPLTFEANVVLSRNLS